MVKLGHTKMIIFRAIHIPRNDFYIILYDYAKNAFSETKRGREQNNLRIYVHYKVHGFRHVPVENWGRGTGDRARDMGQLAHSIFLYSIIPSVRYQEQENTRERAPERARFLVAVQIWLSTFPAPAA